jgi:hypothetical protein
MAIDKSIWGRHMWFTLHNISLAYPNTPNKTDKENYKAFFYLIKDILPCKICSDHYKENLLKLPLTDEILSNKELFIKWVIDMHNLVNENINKKIIDYKDARKLIENNNFYNTEDNNSYQKSYLSCISENPISNYFLIIIFLIVIFIIYKKM